jgi:putative NIF3 family GTP cyclohydrolase 1 type 2
MKAGDVVDAISKWAHVEVELNPTCDVYRSGTPDTEVSGIVTSFMATVDVIRKAIELGANMIITHEPTFFTGWDTTDWLENDAVYGQKRDLIEAHGVVIWRCHDKMHMTKPDGIYAGLLRELEWEGYRQESGAESRDINRAWADVKSAFNDYYVIPRTTVGKLAEYFKTKLQMGVVRIVGSPEMECERVGILVGGASIGLGVDEALPMKIMRTKSIDVMVCGEITEWTLCAYVNDARMLGLKKALLIIGHERSEEWGMKHMAEWLRPLVSGLPVTFVDAQEPFRYL